MEQTSRSGANYQYMTLSVCVCVRWRVGVCLGGNVTV
jgi:hypothetical protein